MRQKLQEDLLSFIDETVVVLEGFKKNKNINLKTEDQLDIINQHILLLKEEKNKVKERELVIAVVGTMKAGKSTTINSIVGSEILPNRNEAMTSLPTLISHVGNMPEPKLYFPHVGPVNELIKQIKGELQRLDKPEPQQETTAVKRGDVVKQAIAKRAQKILDPKAAARQAAAKEAMDKERRDKIEQFKKRFQDIISNINFGYLFKTEYVGQKAIFDFLKILNDIVRIAGQLGTPFPYSEYTSLANLPRIEVTFTTLDRYGEYDDKLTLLDTPGPNEAGQDHFKPMLDDQLKKSSAVITVVDYTQLNTTSENELRQTILGLKDSFASVGTSIPVYAVVNKFDNITLNSLDKEGVKQRVGEELFEGVIPPEHVLPYGALGAFQANLGLDALSKDKEFNPDLDWVKNLKGRCSGGHWSRLLKNPEWLKEHFEDQLKDSLFDEMIDTCVIQNYHNVFPQVLESGLNKALIALDEIKNPLNVLYQSINTDADQLRVAIENVKKNLKEFEKARRDFDNTFKQKMKDTDRLVKATIKGETGEAEKKWGNFKYDITKEYNNRTFESREAVEKLSNTLSRTALITIKGLRRTATMALESSFDDIKQELAGYAKNRVETVKDKIFNDLKGDGIDATDWKPKMTQLKLEDPEEIQVQTSIKTKEVATTKRRRQEGIWGGICRFFGTSDWGWEEYTHYDKVYSIDIDSLLSQFDNLVKETKKELIAEANNIFEYDIKQSFEEYFGSITDRIQQISDNMYKSIELNEGEATEAVQTKKDIDTMKLSIDECLAKAEIIKEEMKAI